jgi:hypothetical protein
MIRTHAHLLSQQNDRSWWKSITIELVVFLYMLAIYIAIPTDEALLFSIKKFVRNSTISPSVIP